MDAFLAVSSQWRWVAGLSGMVATGLDYAGVSAGLSQAGIALSPEEWAEFRAIERAAREALNGD